MLQPRWKAASPRPDQRLIIYTCRYPCLQLSSQASRILTETATEPDIDFKGLPRPLFNRQSHIPSVEVRKEWYIFLIPCGNYLGSNQCFRAALSRCKWSGRVLPRPIVRKNAEARPISRPPRPRRLNKQRACGVEQL